MKAGSMQVDLEASSSHRQREAAKRILCAMIQAEGGKFQGQTRLYKAFYWAHLYFWQNFEGVLSAYPIARMPQGPGIDDGEDLLFEMQRQGLIRITRAADGEFPERTFKLAADFEVNLTPEEAAAVKHGLKKVKGKTAKQVSKETHANSRSWKRLANGKIMDIYEDLLTDKEAEKAARATAEINGLLDEAFGSSGGH